MGERYSHQFHPRNLDVSGGIPYMRNWSIPSELAPELQKYLHVFGPTPRKCLAAFVDLGLSDHEIGRYHKIPAHRVAELRDIWDIKDTI